jgi:hypothetical protein
MIICAGFVNSGTRLLHKIVRYDLGLRAVHRSYPHWEKLWDWRDYPDDITWVAIHRRPDVAIPAAHKAGHPGVRKNIRRDPPATIEEITYWYQRWWKMAADMPAIWICYRDLVARPQQVVGHLARILGCEGDYELRQIRDENAKWLDPAPS